MTELEYAHKITELYNENQKLKKLLRRYTELCQKILKQNSDKVKLGKSSEKKCIMKTQGLTF